MLTPAKPKGAETDAFSYDPADPVPSMGGNVCCSTVPSGPWDQRMVETRKDVLVYTTPEMKEPTEITGPIKMELFAATSARIRTGRRSWSMCGPMVSPRISSPASSGRAIARALANRRR